MKALCCRNQIDPTGFVMQNGMWLITCLWEVMKYVADIDLNCWASARITCETGSRNGSGLQDAPLG